MHDSNSAALAENSSVASKWSTVFADVIATSIGVGLYVVVFHNTLTGLLIAALISLVTAALLRLVLNSLAGNQSNALRVELVAEPAPAPSAIDQQRSVPVVDGASPENGDERLAMLTRVLNHHSARIRHGQVYFAPNIPANKLQNAIAKFAPLAPGERPLLLIDNTVFGSAKDGLLMTDVALYAHNPLEAPQRLRLDQVETAHWTDHRLCGELSLNGTKFFECSVVPRDVMRAVPLMLNDIAKELQPDRFVDQEQSIVEKLRELKGLVDEGILNAEEFETKKKRLLQRP